MRRLGALLVVILALGCNGSTAPGAHPKLDVAVEEPEPDAGSTPAPDTAVSTPEDTAPLPPDAPLVPADAPVVVPPMGPGPDTTVNAFSGMPVYFAGM